MSSIIKVNTVQDQDGNNIINENADTITVGASGDTVTVAGNIVKTNAVQASDAGNIISQSGTTITLGASGDTINIASGATLVGGGLTWDSTVKTANFTAAAGEGYFINTDAGAFEVDLPGSPSVGDQIEFVDFTRNFGTNNLTLDQGSNKFQSQIASAKKPVLSTDGQNIRIVYSGSVQGWIPTTDDAVEYFTNPTRNIEYLCVGGGGTGAGGDGGGGGAGGFLTNVGGTAIGLTPGAAYTVTVGGGGSGVPGNPKTQGNSGTNSVLSGTGISTVTSIGGGGAGSSLAGIRDGLAGGSGGGAGGHPSGVGGSGTVGQGNDGADGPAGGGGGAGEAGNTDGLGYGGDGLSNSITGSAVFYGGGGGGSPSPSSPTYPGGQGGGGDGVINPASTPNATSNLGGGSGGANDGTIGNGGSGVVILRVLASEYPGTTTGSPTVTDDGSYKVIKFTGSGSYTA
jgi:hypothetical protein